METMATGLYVAIDFKPNIGGIAEHTHQMARHMTELGERITVITPSLPGGAEFDENCEYPVIRFDTKLPVGNWLKSRLDRRLLIAGILKAARHIDVDYLICDRWSPIAGANMFLASKLLDKPFFLFAHGSEFSQPVPLGFLRKTTVQSASRVICVSNYIRSLVLDDGIKSDKAVTIPNGFDYREVDSYRSRSYAGRFPSVDSAFPSGCPTILTVSRLMDRKGIDRVIEAMPKIIAEVPETRYIIVGNGGDRNRLSSLVSESLARDSITFLGPLTGDEKFECYDRCDVFVLPSRDDGFAMVFPEANAFGKPVVGGRSGGVPDVITHGENGLLVDPCDIDEIAESVIRLIKEPSEAQRLGNNGKYKVKNEFNWKMSAANLISVLYDSIKDTK